MILFVYISSLSKGMYRVYPYAKELISGSLRFDHM